MAPKSSSLKTSSIELSVVPAQAEALDIVILGLSITSSWGNGHATCYRGLVRALARQGHRVLFLERDVPWYADNRDLPKPPYGTTRLYRSLDELRTKYRARLRAADLVIVGSYVPEGVAVGTWALETAPGIVAFYDIDTPVTLAKLDRGDYEYLTPELIARYDLYLSFTGGPILKRLEQHFGSPMARPLYCAFDPELYYPEPCGTQYDLGYMGTYSVDRQPTLERLLMRPASQSGRMQFVVAGPQYPKEIRWPRNVKRIEHLPPANHRQFYCSQRFTLNVTRRDMIEAGYSPSVRLFEAAACGTPIISDWWTGLDDFFTPGEEILVAHSPADVVRHLQTLQEGERQQLAERARARVLREHTCEHRARELERYCRTARQRRSRGANPLPATVPGTAGSAVIS